MKKVLLNKTHDIEDFAPKDSSRYTLNSVHYNAKEQCLEAVNGSIIIRVPVVESEEFPPTKHALDTPPVDCIIPLPQFKKAMGNIPKSKLPVLEHVALDANGSITLTTTDLDTEQAITCKPVDGTYPNCSQVIPNEPAVLRIALNAELLLKLATYARKHSNDGSKTITFEFLAPDKPVRFSLNVDSINGPVKATGILMPVKLP